MVLTADGAPFARAAYLQQTQLSASASHPSGDQRAAATSVAQARTTQIRS